MDTAYADTNIYLDWFERRSGRKFLYSQAEDAQTFFNSVEEGKYKLATSDHLVHQLSAHLSRYDDYIANLDRKSLHIHVICEPADKKKADEEAVLNRTEYEDALHFVLAMKAGAKVIVTQDEPHFACFRNRIMVASPRMLTLLPNFWQC
ncbi:MAG: PIN domain-containing protein [Candidatus Woesearchaeota archaeon]